MSPSVTLEESLSILLQRLSDFLNGRSHQAGREKGVPNIALTTKERLSPILKLSGTEAEHRRKVGLIYAADEWC